MELSEHDRTHLQMLELEDFGMSDLSSWWEARDELGEMPAAVEDPDAAE
jgi:hypothetical protein